MRKNLKIGKVKIENPLVLAPMAAVNCVAFRVLCKEQGAGLVYTPMICVDDLLGGRENLIDSFVNFIDRERPIAAQIIGNKLEQMKEAAEILSEHADIIDLNFGCMVGEYLGKKWGGYLTKHNEQIPKILSKVVGAVNIPVTAKIRIGWDDNSINAVETAKMVEDSGCCAIAIHARTCKQKFTGKANWNIIKKIKEKVNIPVMGNGDVFKPRQAVTMLGQTKCDFVMIARGAIGNPEIFKRTNELLENDKELPETTWEQRTQTFLRFIELYHKYKKRDRFSEIRDHALWFSKGFKDSSKLKEKIMGTKDETELKKIMSA